MNNIIQQITTNVAKKLEKVLINSLNNKYDFSDIVEELTITGKQVTSNMLNYVLEELEETIRESAEIREKYTIHKRAVSRKILCSFGELEYERTTTKTN